MLATSNVPTPAARISSATACAALMAPAEDPLDPARARDDGNAAFEIKTHENSCVGLRNAKPLL